MISRVNKADGAGSPGNRENIISCQASVGTLKTIFRVALKIIIF